MNYPVETFSLERPLRFLAAAFLVPAILMACSPQGGKPAGQPPRPPAPVKVAPVVAKDMPLQLETIGNIEAYATVNIMPQVTGTVDKVHFKEGDFVKRGDLLYTIDPQPFQVALNQAEALLAKDLAQLDNAKKEERRYDDLVKKGYVSKEQYDQMKTSADTLEASVKADKAAVDGTRLQLSYCYIYSPITGRTGPLLLNAGNTVKPNDKQLLTIYQVEPIYATFTLPQQYLPNIKKYMSKGRLKVRVRIPDNEGVGADGVLTFIDNAVDLSTGTIKLKATFENNNKLLWPGLYVQATLFLTVERDATVVPTSAVMAGQQGRYGYVVKPDGTAENRHLTVRREMGSETIIEYGVAPGETIITDGQLQVIPGSKVKVLDGNAREGSSRR